MKLNRALNFLLDLLYPRRAVCMVCGSELGCDRNDICDDCRAALEQRRIGPRQASMGNAIDAAAFAYGYAGPAGMIVRKLKYGSVKVLSDEMAEAITREVRLLHRDSIEAVTCVPMHAKRLRQRGFNHAELLARGVTEKCGLEYRELLFRTRNAGQQAGLSREARKKNLRNAFALCPEQREWIRGKSILLIDDVYTTGTTAQQCALTLKKAGAASVCFASYAISEEKTANGKNHKR